MNDAKTRTIFFAVERPRLVDGAAPKPKRAALPCDPLASNGFDCFPCDSVLANHPGQVVNAMIKALQEKELGMLIDDYDALSKALVAGATSLEALGQVRTIREAVRAKVARSHIAALKEAIGQLKAIDGA